MVVDKIVAARSDMESAQEMAFKVGESVFFCYSGTNINNCQTWVFLTVKKQCLHLSLKVVP